MKYEHMTDCEETVMKSVWDADHDASLMDIMTVLKDQYGKDWKRQTISTFLLHLIQKGYLTSYRSGRTFYYKPLIPVEGFREHQLDEFVHFWFEGSFDQLLRTANEGKLIRKRDLAKVKKYLESI